MCGIWHLAADKMDETSQNRVKIVFPLTRDSDDYPPADREHVWAIPHGDHYEIDNIPFFVKGVSAGDTVAAHTEGAQLIFDKVIDFGGHSTIRVVMYDLTQKEPIRSKLLQLGCESEGSHLPNLFAVDVPPAVNYAEILTLLANRADDGILDYEEASVQHRMN
jgi:hypothetical protein